MVAICTNKNFAGLVAGVGARGGGGSGNFDDHDSFGSNSGHGTGDSHNPRQTRRFSHEKSRRGGGDMHRRDSLTVELAKLKSIALFQFGAGGPPSYGGGNGMGAGGKNGANPYAMVGGNGASLLSKQDIMTFGKFTVWAEYFNNMRKCWEPLLEKLSTTVIYEKVGAFWT
jgi:hypothetical protein